MVLTVFFLAAGASVIASLAVLAAAKARIGYAISLVAFSG
jgi:hypothetical protein